MNLDTRSLVAFFGASLGPSGAKADGADPAIEGYRSVPGFDAALSELSSIGQRSGDERPEENLVEPMIAAPLEPLPGAGVTQLIAYMKLDRPRESDRNPGLVQSVEGPLVERNPPIPTNDSRREIAHQLSQELHERFPAGSPADIFEPLGRLDEARVDATVDAPAGSESRLSASVDQSEVGEGPPVKAIPLRVTMLENHLPSAIAHAVTTMADRNVDVDMAPPSSVASSSPREAERESLKIIRFELEPVSLGPLSVKMRMSHARVEIEIEVQSGAVLAHLHDMKEKLASVVGATGYAVETLDIRASSAQPSSDIDQARGGDGGQTPSQESHSGERGFDEGEGSGRRRARLGAAHASPIAERRNTRGGGVFL